ncbi:general vesicular transport factor p115-like [Liolophura sinensis]|uniref:general vesicular transport factor p115-like n=1 Tax=Liolophura sinensis TaxID=3198878 RepID=UPI003159099F
MDYLRKYLTGPQAEGQPSGAETVERLCDRAQSSTLLDDRRDAVRALKALSRKFRLEVGTQAMDILRNVLETDRNDAEITGYALDTLCNIMSNEPMEEEDEIPNHLPEDLGGQFTEIFIKNTDSVSLLLSLLEEYDFHVRWPTVKLLTILLTNRGKEMQEIVLVSPMGVYKLMDLLVDSREIIRNDALLLLIQLTKGNANLQKIVAFENAFGRLLDIIHEEGNSDGGIVVEDCLLLLTNLLRNNSSNQNFFKEGSYIQKLTPFFQLESGEMNTQGGWSAQKVTNIHLMLQVVRTLVSPNNPQQQTVACQKVMNTCGLLQLLCSILMASGVPADVLTETINTVSEVIRGNLSNQEYFASVMAPSSPPRPAIVVLLMSMVNEKQPFVLRCAVLYCFQSFLYKNEVGQSQIVQTLLPSSADVNTITAGQLLCGGLFSADSLSNWFAAVALLHAILENPTQKEQLLRVQLATSVGNPPVSLLQQCCNMLAQGGKIQTRVGLLMLLCGWTANCPIAVTHFLHNTANVPYLISQVSSSEGEEQEVLAQGLCAFLLGISILYNNEENDTFNRASLQQIIEKRIGMETFNDKLTQVYKNESYTKAAKKPHLNYKQPNEVMFDFEFTRLFKTLEIEVLRAVKPEGKDAEERRKKMASLKEHESIVDQYKGLIKEQDEQLNTTKQELRELKDKHEKDVKELEQLRDQVQQLKDQNALIKAQKGSQGVPVLDNNKQSEDVSRLKEEVESLKAQIGEKDSVIEKLRNDLSVSEARVLAQTIESDENKENNPSEVAVLQSTVEKTNAELQDTRKSLTDRQEEVSRLSSRVAMLEKEKSELVQRLSEQPSEQATNTSELDAKVASLTKDLENIRQEKESLQKRLQASEDEKSSLNDKIQELEKSKVALEEEKAEALESSESMKKEQDELLVLLADQDAKLATYKSKLKELGQEVEDDDDDYMEHGDEDDEDDDDE